MTGSTRGGRNRGRQVTWWVGAALVLCATGWAARTLGPHIPIYWANLRFRMAVDALDVGALGGRVLIVAPHPDDETLGPGGLIQQAIARGAEVYVVVMTNGDAYQYERAVMVVQDIVRGSAAEHRRVGRSRQQETLKALAGFGVPPDHVTFLGYPDTGVHFLWQPPYWSLDHPYRSPNTRTDHNPYEDSLSPGQAYSGAAVLHDLQRVIGRLQPTALLTTAPLDVHPDHWATYGFVRAAVECALQRNSHPMPVYAFLIHRHDWPAPQGYDPRRPLVPPAAWKTIGGVRWWRLELTPEQVETKRRSLALYRSQNAARSTELQSLVRRNELFAVLDDYRDPSWPVAIADPVADLPPDRVRPAEDIRAVELAQEGDSYRLTLRLAGRADRKLRYAILWHSLGPQTARASSVVWTRGLAYLLECDERGDVGRQRIESQVAANSLSVHVSAQSLTGPGILLEAYSQRGRRYIDHTMTVLIREKRDGGDLRQSPILGALP